MQLALTKFHPREQCEVEGVAIDLLRDAGMSYDPKPDPFLIVVVLGFDLWPEPPPETHGWYDLERLRFYYQPSADVRVECFTLAHELGHFGWEDRDVPLALQPHELVNATARAILMPHDGLAWRIERGDSLPELARFYDLVPLDQIRLRVREVSGLLGWP